MIKKKYTIGVDFGSDSVRSILVNTATGEVLSSSVSKYKRWSKGLFCNPDISQFRQHPKDYIEGLKETIKDVLSPLSDDVITRVLAVSIATTGSTPVAVNKAGVPLSLTEDFEDNPNAMFVLWKDHTGIKEALEINKACSESDVNYTKYEGGIYSAEWFWSKVLHISREDKKVRESAFSWVEHCDWMTGLLTGDTNPLTIKRSRCASGHKAMWHADWGGLPPEDFLVKLDPLLVGLRERLYTETYVSGVNAGTISKEWAQELGLPNDVVIGVGSFDAHMGAVGGEIRSNYLVKVIGTSTCDMVVVPNEQMNGKLVSGICGQVDGSILPGMVGLEAGQSAFGDVYAWFRDLLFWPIKNSAAFSNLSLNKKEKEALLDEIKDGIIPELVEGAKKIPIKESGIIALDWMNGRRTPDSNQNLKGAIHGLDLGTTPPKIFKALVEATAFGSKKIVDQFLNEGIQINGVIAVGGVAQKSDFVMQILTDVLNMPISIAKSQETCALGAAMSAAVAGGVYNSFTEAREAMGEGFQKEYLPIYENVIKYNELYNKYQVFADFVEAKLTTAVEQDELI